MLSMEQGFEPHNTSRRERERLGRRQEMIDAARAVFAARGFYNTTLEDVASLAEFGKGTLYNYFPSKEALFQSVLEDSFGRMKSIAESALSEEGSFEEKIYRFLIGELSYFMEDPESLRLMMRESHLLRNDNPMMTMMPEFLTIVATTIESEQNRGTLITAATPFELATILLNLLFGQFMSRIYSLYCGRKELIGGAGEKREMPNVDVNFDDQHILDAARLIHAVYFRGISR